MTDDRRRLTYLVSSLEVGGAERGMARLLPDLSEDYDVTVVALRGGDGAIVEELPPAVDVIDLAVGSPRDLPALRRLYRHLTRTDVLVCSLYHAAVVGNVLGRLASVPTVLTWRHLERYDSPLREFLYARSVRWSDVVLADSEAVAAMLGARDDLRGARVHTVPIAGVDTDQYAPRERSTDDVTVVGMLGRLAPQKNHDALLAAAEALRDETLEFHVAGSGPREAELRRQVAERGLESVHLRGFVDDVPAFLNELDVYVQPSTNEGLCITAVEAMACGLPVVASAVGGLTETVVDGETGYLVDPGDVAALTERVRELHRDPERRAAFGRRGRDRVVEHYSRTQLVDSFRDAVALAQRT